MITRIGFYSGYCIADAISARTNMAEVHDVLIGAFVQTNHSQLHAS